MRPTNRGMDTRGRPCVLSGGWLSSRAPDIQALREAVTFGGYRLGERTNVEDVKMLYGGTELSVSGNTVTKKRYWSYAAIEERYSELGVDERIEQASELWTRAIKRRLPRNGRFTFVCVAG